MGIWLLGRDYLGEEDLGFPTPWTDVDDTRSGLSALFDSTVYDPSDAQRWPEQTLGAKRGDKDWPTRDMITGAGVSRIRTLHDRSRCVDRYDRILI